MANEHRFYEKHERTFVKTVTYRIAIIISTLIITWFVTYDLTTVLSITSIATVASTIIYYLHERIWNGIHWGKVKKTKK